MFFNAGDISSYFNQTIGDQKRLDQMEDTQQAREFAQVDRGILQMQREVSQEMKSPVDSKAFTSRSSTARSAMSAVSQAKSSGFGGGDRIG